MKRKYLVAAIMAVLLAGCGSGGGDDNGGGGDNGGGDVIPDYAFDGLDGAGADTITIMVRDESTAMTKLCPASNADVYINDADGTNPVKASVGSDGKVKASDIPQHGFLTVRTWSNSDASVDDTGADYVSIQKEAFYKNGYFVIDGDTYTGDVSATGCVSGRNSDSFTVDNSATDFPSVAIAEPIGVPAEIVGEGGGDYGIALSLNYNQVDSSSKWGSTATTAAEGMDNEQGNNILLNDGMKQTDLTNGDGIVAKTLEYRFLKGGSLSWVDGGSVIDNSAIYEPDGADYDQLAITTVKLQSVGTEVWQARTATKEGDTGAFSVEFLDDDMISNMSRDNDTGVVTFDAPTFDHVLLFNELLYVDGASRYAHDTYQVTHANATIPVVLPAEWSGFKDTAELEQNDVAVAQYPAGADERLSIMAAVDFTSGAMTKEFVASGALAYNKAFLDTAKIAGFTIAVDNTDSLSFASDEDVSETAPVFLTSSAK
ncbi:hypothetical protein HC723_11480 [Vibrio sp. S11_S32]|uniref:hypothetical protein n=1 Tax=Vibrio sp. S11_S32 TaxID=2720225 RepID=UPI001680D90A|nr:hypothetical protein [Vibrio sp. S11_S32]MBD1577052.1 hypothetical protein [Vibrio sp. S11_S32]